MQNQDQLKLNVSLDKTTKFECEECGGDIFSEGLLLRRVSKFLTGNNKDGIIPIPVFHCVKCNHVNEELLPPQLRKNQEGDSTDKKDVN